MSFLAPQRNDALTIRRAAVGDAGEIARVQVQSWREAYAGIIPASYLAQLSAAAHQDHWQATLSGGAWAFVATWEGRVAGFASGGLSRIRRDITGEIHVLYVLRAFQRRGAGRALFDACHYELARCGHHGLLVWVLADNPAVGFYERLGGTRAGENHVLVGGTRLRELAYVWPD